MQKEKVLIPQIRFPEFKENWNLDKIGNIGYFYYGKSAPKWSVTEDAKIPCIRYGELYSKFNEIITEVFSYTNIEPKNLKFSKGGEILVPRVGENPLEFANCSHLTLSNVAIGEMISVYNTNEDSLFFTYCFNATCRKSFAKVVEGANVSNLYFRYLENIEVSFPSIEEQKQIADFITAISERIQTLEKKKSLLEEYKKGVMQKIFKQEIRFKDDDGNDFPKWEYVKLKEVLKRSKLKNTDLKVKYVLTNSATQGIVSQNDYFDKDIANQNNLQGYYIVEKDDFIYNPRISQSAPVGPLKRNKLAQGVMSPLYTVLTPQKGNLEFFEFYFDTTLWHKYMKAIANYGARHDRMNITMTDFENLLIPYPSPKEQTKIANFLSAIDKNITLVNDKIERTKSYKKGLLQQMFV